MTGYNYVPPLREALFFELAQAICGDDHLTCSWPQCGCKSTKRKVNAAALVVGTEIERIRSEITNTFFGPPTSTDRH